MDLGDNTGVIPAVHRGGDRGWDLHYEESGHPTPASRFAAGFRMPLAEPGVRLSLRTGLSIDVYA